ncbi:MAG: sterol desaturase/sphingolipid hydroxylase (fatty acid hydroxylase superfamily) [Crocinitomicaceae bacterium]|jgi:sterol desaturase/sphingolipid hydroxylase (fatty acid hydroxylase superfamily)
MNYVFLLFEAAIILLALSILYIPMEKVFPGKRGQKVFRKRWLVDLCFFLGQYLFLGGVVAIGIDYIADFLDFIVPLKFRIAVASQPFYLQIIEVVILSDFFIYWAHRLQHKVNFLWRFHKVHHSAKHLDWLAAHREHPLDSIYTIGIINLPAMILGFPVESIAILVAFRGFWAIYIHSNVRLPLPFLRTIIGSPELHHWHHDLERDRGNYANISPLMDILFGTYTCPDHEPENFGIKEEFSENYLGQLIQPVLPDSIWEKMQSKRSIDLIINHFQPPTPSITEEQRNNPDDSKATIHQLPEHRNPTNVPHN